MNDKNSELLKKIILIKEALDPKYIYFEDYLKHYDRKAFNVINDKEKLVNILNNYENLFTYKELLKPIDKPEIRYLYFSDFHDAKIYNVEYTNKALYIHLNGSQALAWPKGMKEKMIVEFKGAKDVLVDKLPSYFDACDIQLLGKKYMITISSTCKSCSFKCDDVKFISVD